MSRTKAKQYLLVLMLFSILLFLLPISMPIARGSPLSSGINIVSPMNVTYSPIILTLNISARAILGSGTNLSMLYSIDGKNNVSLPTKVLTSQMDFVSTIVGSDILPQLQEGFHNLTVYSRVDYKSPSLGTTEDYNIVFFAIDNGKAPSIAIAVQNNSYQEACFNLNFSIDEPTSWIGCSVDGGAFTTIPGNTTISSLSSGQHYVTLWANDTIGNMGHSDTIIFTISQSPSPMPQATGSTISSLDNPLSPSSSKLQPQSSIPEFAPTIILTIAVLSCIVVIIARKRFSLHKPA